MSARLNFLCVSADELTLKRCQETAREFEYSYQQVPKIEALVEMMDKFDLVQFVLYNASQVQNKDEISGAVQAIRQIFKDSFICVVVNKKIPPELASFVKKSGAHLLLLENEFHETSRLEFIASQIIRASYVPVKLTEFPKDCVLDFTLFHLMPLNQKLIPVLPKGTPLAEGRMKKLEGIGEVFVKREEVDRYRHYVEGHPDMSGTGLKSRCRAQYLSFCNSHTQLIFLLLDQSESGSYKEGKWLYDRCEILAKDLITTLSAVGEAWDIVNNSSIGEFGSVERAPTIAAYSGLLSLLTTLGEPVEVMTAALLSDVGMLELHPRITKKLRQTGNFEELSPEDLEAYKKHPVLSVNRCLERKLQLPDGVKEFILNTHERADGKGFPAGRTLDKIPQEAMLIQFSELIDRGAMIRMGHPRTSVQQVRDSLMESEFKSGKIFSLAFMQKLKPVV
ncbi:MAG: HD-GYP domain-containing protein [Pseudobdellovibrionaceae bacterium]